MYSQVNYIAGEGVGRINFGLPKSVNSFLICQELCVVRPYKFEFHKNSILLGLQLEACLVSRIC